MTDVYSKEKRSEIMSKIKGKDTKIEVLVRKWLYSNGFRYRKNDARYPGRPDIVLPAYKTVIFVHGCFWHGHVDCKYNYIPKTRTDFWLSKKQSNISRDDMKIRKLQSMGWNVIVIWECELKKVPEKRLDRLLLELKNLRSEI